MRYRVLKSAQLTTKLTGYRGDVVELDAAAARMLIARGYLEPIATDPPSLGTGTGGLPEAPRDQVLRGGRDAVLTGTVDTVIPTATTPAGARRR